MSITTIILGTLVAIEFFYIFYLETIATVFSNTARVFKMEEEELRRSSVTALFKNQGVYNELIGVLVLISLFIAPSVTWVALLSYIVLVELYASLTSDKMILLKQGGLAILTLLTLL